MGKRIQVTVSKPVRRPQPADIDHKSPSGKREYAN